MTNKISDYYYLDANFLVCIFISKHQFHESSTKLLVKLLQKKKRFLISCLTLDEAWHKSWLTLQDQVPKEKRKPHSVDGRDKLSQKWSLRIEPLYG